MNRMEAKEKRRIIEALILSSSEPISAAKLAEMRKRFKELKEAAK